MANQIDGGISYDTRNKSAATSGEVSDKNKISGEVTAAAKSDNSATGDNTAPTEEQKTDSVADASAANVKSYADMIRQQYDAMNQQQALNIDYKTQTAVDQSVWGYQDQLPDIQSAYRDNTTQMYQGMDNAALNARANGQYGGTATEKVGAIQSQYQQARNELAIKQRKLADDTINQINVLRRNGEYEKADALLKSAQQELDAIYKDAIRVDENQYSNWQYQTSLDREDAAIQREQEANDRDYTRQIGMMLLQYGIVPDDDMLSVMGIDKTTAQAYATYMKTYGR